MSNITIQNLVEYIARGHAFEKHVLGRDLTMSMQGINAFRATQTKGYYDKKEDRYIAPQTLRGGDLFIETPDDLAHYIEHEFLKSPHTHGYVFHEKNSVCLCNSKDNVAMYLTWNNEDKDFGSIFRYTATQAQFTENINFLRQQERILNNILITEFDNKSDPNAALTAISIMLEDINSNPQNYLFNKNDPNSTVQNEIFANAHRPGRTWEHDRIINSTQNVRGHSEIYAQKMGLDVNSTSYACMETAEESELNIGRISGSLGSRDSVGFHKSLGKLVRKTIMKNSENSISTNPVAELT